MSRHGIIQHYGVQMSDVKHTHIWGWFLISLALVLSACEEASEWDCTCEITCDGTALDDLEINDVCGPPDATEAVREVADGCTEGLQEGGCSEVECACSCESQRSC